MLLAPVYFVVAGCLPTCLDGISKLGDNAPGAKFCLEGLFVFDGLSTSKEEPCSDDSPLAGKDGAPGIREVGGIRELDGDRENKLVPLCLRDGALDGDLE